MDLLERSAEGGHVRRQVADARVVVAKQYPDKRSVVRKIRDRAREKERAQVVLLHLMEASCPHHTSTNHVSN